MLAVERRNLILEKLQEDKKVIVSELSQEFQVSEGKPYAGIWISWIRTALPLRATAERCSMKIRVWICPLISGRKTIRRENRK